MKFMLACFTWITIGVVIGVSLLLLVKGSPWLFIVAMLAFLGGMVKYGCLSH